jgi:recombinational DNA repair ATPase RecF
MALTSIKFDGKEYKLEDGVNYISGPCGSGKSRFLKALMELGAEQGIVVKLIANSDFSFCADAIESDRKTRRYPAFGRKYFKNGFNISYETGTFSVNGKGSPLRLQSRGERVILSAVIETADAFHEKADVLTYDDHLGFLDKNNQKRFTDFLARVGKKKQVFITCRELPKGISGNKIMLVSDKRRL